MSSSESEGPSDETGRAAVPLEMGYEFLEELSVGGTGIVHRARDRALERDVAIKILRAQEGATQDQRSRFLQEARAMAKVRHKNVLRIQTVDEVAGEIRLVMELIEGRTLRALVEQDGPLSARESAQVGIDLCHALGALHQVGLVHMDVKPENVMREKGGRTVLLDLGLVRSPDLAGQSTGGTPPFMAPEHFGRGAPGAHTDIYGLGATLYWLLCGRYPVDAESIGDLRRDVLEGQVIPLLDRRPDLPSGLAAIIERAMRVEPEKRFGSVGHLERALRAFVAGDEGAGAPARRAVRRRGALAGIALVLTLAGVWLCWRPEIVDADRAFELRASLTLHPVGDEPYPATESSAVRIGDSLTLEVEGEEPFYLYLFNEDEQGLCYTLYPPRNEQELLPAGKPMTLPRGGGQWRVSTQGGTEHLFLIASRERNALGELLRERVPRPDRVAAEFRVSRLDEEERVTLRDAFRAFGVETVPPETAAAAEPRSSLARYFADYADDVRTVPGVHVERWALKHRTGGEAGGR